VVLDSLLIFPIVSFGLTFLIKDSKIFSPIRKWLTPSHKCSKCESEEERGVISSFFYKLFQCSFCVGTWVGLFLGGLIIASSWPMNWLEVFTKLVIYSMLSATASYVIDLLTQKLETWVIDQQ
jgi:hypothetical protein